MDETASRSATAPRPRPARHGHHQSRDSAGLAAAKTDDERLANGLGALAARESRTPRTAAPADRPSDTPPSSCSRTRAPPARARSSGRRAPSAHAALRSRCSSVPCPGGRGRACGARRRPCRARRANIAALNDLASRAEGQGVPPALLDAFDASTLARASLRPRRCRVRARQGRPRRSAAAEGVERMAFERTGRETWPSIATTMLRPTGRAHVPQREARRRRSRRRGARARAPARRSRHTHSISRSPAQRVEVGDLPRAARSSRPEPRRPPALTLWAIKGKAPARAASPRHGRARRAVGAPGLSALPGRSLAAFEGVAERYQRRQVRPLLANAATAVLAHQERTTSRPRASCTS